MSPMIENSLEPKSRAVSYVGTPTVCRSSIKPLHTFQCALSLCRQLNTSLWICRPNSVLADRSLWPNRTYAANALVDALTAL